MNDEQIAAGIAEQLLQSDSWSGGELAQVRMKALQYYYGSSMGSAYFAEYSSNFLRKSWVFTLVTFATLLIGIYSHLVQLSVFIHRLCPVVKANALRLFSGRSRAARCDTSQTFPAKCKIKRF